MALWYKGINVGPSDVRRLLPVARSGLSAKAIAKAGEQLGVEIRGHRISADKVQQVPIGSILHWEHRHFVVLERARRDGTVTVMDPARGACDLEADEFSDRYSGVALVIEMADPSRTAPASRRPRQTFPRQVIRPFFDDRRRWGLLFLTSMALQIATLSLPLQIRQVINQISSGKGLRSSSIASVTAVFMICYVALSLARSASLVVLGASGDRALMKRILDRMTSLPYRFFQTRTPGDLLMRVRSTTIVRQFITSTAVRSMLDSIAVVTAVALIASIDVYLGLVTIGLAALELGMVFVCYGPLRYAANRSLDAQSRSHGQLVELMVGIKSLKAAGAESARADTVAQTLDDEILAESDHDMIRLIATSMVDSIRTWSPLVVFLVGSTRVASEELSLGNLVAVSALAPIALGPLASLATASLGVSRLASYLVRLGDILDTPSEASQQSGAQRLVFTGSVKAHQVSYSYGPFEPNVLHRCAASVVPGQRLGIVGSSGSGKSTLAMLMAGLLTPNVGDVTFDGRSIRDLDLPHLRRQIGVVSQESYVFAGSIRANVDLSARLHANDERIVEACRVVRLHDEIDAMPLGYETIVADGGSNLSGGQRQRLVLARALLHRPSLLVLDEATSSLDSQTETEIMANLATLDCAMVIVAHRLSTIRFCDEILVVDKGRIVEVGIHSDLVDGDGTYARMVRAQEQ